MNNDIQNFIIPSEFTRPPRAIEDSAHYKADEWKNWLLYFSDVLVLDRLPQEHFENLMCFHQAVLLFQGRSITVENLAKGEDLLISFVRQYEKLYGKDKMVLNVHSLLHLPMYVRKFGPLQSFWCFPLESMLGLHKSGVHGTRLVDEAYFQFAALSSFIGNLQRDLYHRIESEKNNIDCDVLWLLHKWESSTIVDKRQDVEFKGTNGVKSSYPHYNIAEFIQTNSILACWKFNRAFWRGNSLSNNTSNTNKSNSVVLLQQSVAIIQQFYSFETMDQSKLILILVNEYDIDTKSHLSIINLTKGRTKYIQVHDLKAKGMILTSSNIKRKFGSNAFAVKSL